MTKLYEKMGKQKAASQYSTGKSSFHHVTHQEEKHAVENYFRDTKGYLVFRELLVATYQSVSKFTT